MRIEKNALQAAGSCHKPPRRASHERPAIVKNDPDRVPGGAALEFDHFVAIMIK